MDTSAKPLLKYTADERRSSPQGGVHAVWAKVQLAARTVTKCWAKAVRIIHFREVFAEFLATFALVTFGNGAIAQAILSRDRGVAFVENGTSVFIPPLGTEMSINLGYGVGVMIGAYIAIGVTGGHMNPAVTLAMALRGRTCWLKVIPYWIAQFLGAFFSAAVVYGTYVDALDSYVACKKHSIPCTATIFATYPQDYLTLGRGVLDQIVGTFLLLLGVFAITDEGNAGMKKGVQPIAIGFLLWGIGASFGFNAGYAINPARDLAPRVFTAIAGWGKDVFVCSVCHIRHWWWVPVVAPMIGAILAAFFYWLLIDAHHPPPRRDDESSPSVNNQ